MPIQPSLTRPASLRSVRRRPAVRRVQTVGQCFEINISRDISGWTVRIPEINAETHARSRGTVEVAARSCIADRTGIPIGYISILVRD